MEHARSGAHTEYLAYPAYCTYLNKFTYCPGTHLSVNAREYFKPLGRKMFIPEGREN